MYPKRTTVTLLQEWEPMLGKLKQEQFFNDTREAMFRYIIERGLASIKDEKLAQENRTKTPYLSPIANHHHSPH